MSNNSFSRGCGALKGTAGPTFEEYQTVFMTQITRTRSGNTILSYRRVLARAGRVWGECRLADITKAMVRSYVEQLTECYRHSTVCLHFDMLRCFFRTAVEDEVIACSPMQSLKKPARSKDDSLVRTGKAYTEREMRFILKCMESEPLKYKAMVYFMADSGCRRGTYVWFFTLVELIVVLVILAILAAMLVPALTGYIKRAREEKEYQAASSVYTAAQALATEAFGRAASATTPSYGTYITVAQLQNLTGLSIKKAAYTVVDTSGAYNEAAVTAFGESFDGTNWYNYDGTQWTHATAKPSGSTDCTDNAT